MLLPLRPVHVIVLLLAALKSALFTAGFDSSNAQAIGPNTSTAAALALGATPNTSTGSPLAMTVTSNWRSSADLSLATDGRAALTTLSGSTLPTALPPVDGAALPPVDCLVHNWHTMVCSWTPLDPAAVYSLSWSAREIACKRRLKFSNCPSPGNGSCTWLSDSGPNQWHYGTYCLRLDARSPLHNAYNCSCKPYATKVMPGMVANLKATNLTMNSVQLEWNSPNRKESIRYRIRISQQSVDQSPQTEIEYKYLVSNSSLVSFELLSLTPETAYTVTIDCIPSDNTIRGVGIQGVWSLNVSTYFETPEDVTRWVCSVTSGGFNTALLPDGRRSVEVYWQWLQTVPASGSNGSRSQTVPKSRTNGSLIHATVRYRPRNDSIGASLSSTEPWLALQYSGGETSCSLNLSMEHSYDVIIESSALIGYNANYRSSSLFIPKQMQMPKFPDTFFVLVNRTEFSWHWSGVEAATGYTIYWCFTARLVARCLPNSLSWRTVSADRRMATISLSTSADYMFGLSAECNASDDVISSGIMWTRCSYDVTMDIVKPANVRISERQLADSLTVEWDTPGSCRKTGYISHYVIAYCRLPHCSSLTEYDTLNVSSSEGSATIRNLLGGSVYRVQVKSWSILGESPYSPPVDAIVLSSGLSGGQLTLVALGAALLLACLLLVVHQLCRRMLRKMCKPIDVEVPQTKYEIQSRAVRPTALDDIYNQRVPHYGQADMSGSQRLVSQVSPESGYVEDLELMKRHPLCGMEGADMLSYAQLSWASDTTHDQQQLSPFSLAGAGASSLIRDLHRWPEDSAERSHAGCTAVDADICGDYSDSSEHLVTYRTLGTQRAPLASDSGSETGSSSGVVTYTTLGSKQMTSNAEEKLNTASQVTYTTLGTQLMPNVEENVNLPSQVAYKAVPTQLDPSNLSSSSQVTYTTLGTQLTPNNVENLNTSSQVTYTTLSTQLTPSSEAAEENLNSSSQVTNRTLDAAEVGLRMDDRSPSGELPNSSQVTYTTMLDAQLETRLTDSSSQGSDVSPACVYRRHRSLDMTECDNYNPPPDDFYSPTAALACQ